MSISATFVFPEIGKPLDIRQYGKPIRDAIRAALDRAKDLTPNAKRIWTYLSWLVNCKEEYAFPSHEELAERFAVSLKTIQRALRRLAKTGWLRYEPGAGDRGNKMWVLLPVSLERSKAKMSSLSGQNDQLKQSKCPVDKEEENPKESLNNPKTTTAPLVENPASDVAVAESSSKNKAEKASVKVLAELETILGSKPEPEQQIAEPVAASYAEIKAPVVPVKALPKIKNTDAVEEKLKDPNTVNEFEKLRSLCTDHFGESAQKQILQWSAGKCTLAEIYNAYKKLKRKRNLVGGLIDFVKDWESETKFLQQRKCEVSAANEEEVRQVFNEISDSFREELEDNFGGQEGLLKLLTINYPLIMQYKQLTSISSAVTRAMKNPEWMVL